MRNVLLVEPEIPRGWGSNQQFIGLLKIGAYHRAVGDNVVYVKGCVPGSSIDGVPDLVCVTSMFTYWWKPVWEAVQYYKKMYPSAHVQLGGIYATLCPDHAKESGADEVVIGPHPEAKNYPPDPTLLPEKPKFVYLMTSHGCSGSCTFCATHLLYGHGIQHRPIDDVLDEIKLQYDRGFRKIYIGDDDFGHDAENYMIPLLEAVIDSGMKIDFYLYGGMQARSITLSSARLLKKARFKQLSLGFESVDPDVLKRMGRTRLGGVKVLENAIHRLEEAGFKRNSITVFFMIGLPYQELEDMIDTLTYIVGLGVWAQPQRWAPIPGTADYKKYNLETYLLEELYYKSFIAPNQTEFTDEDLNAIYRLARFFNMGRRYSNYDFLAPEHIDKAVNLFKKKLVSILS